MISVCLSYFPAPVVRNAIATILTLKRNRPTFLPSSFIHTHTCICSVKKYSSTRYVLCISEILTVSLWNWINMTLFLLKSSPVIVSFETRGQDFRPLNPISGSISWNSGQVMSAGDPRADLPVETLLCR